MTTRYDAWVELKPRNRVAIFFVIVASFSLFVLYRVDVSGWVGVLAYCGLITCILIGAPQLFSWYASMIIQHVAALHEAKAIERTDPDLIIKERLLTKYDYLINRIASLSDLELQAVLAIPTPADIEMLPAGGEFLVLAHRGGRISMPVIEDIAGKWVRMTQQGRNVFHLPPLRVWSGRMREQVREVYLELAAEGLIIVRNDKAEPWAGNMTAMVAPSYSPVDVLNYLRVSNHYQFDEDALIESEVDEE